MLLAQYYRLKPPVKSILRIVSADFNENTTEGKRMAEIQRKLFLNDKVLDIVLRLNNKNEFLKSGILNTKVG
jgi:hypothetical protein